MTTLEFLSHLRDQGIKIWVEGEKLRFRAPKQVMTPALRAEITERKPEIIQFFGQLTDHSHADMPPIKPVPRDQPLPLSASQQRLWFLDQLDPGVPSYSIYDATDIRGPLDMDVLVCTLTELVRRHEVLRTTFPTGAGVPVQVIAPPQIFHVPLIDLTELAESERLREGQRLALEEARLPFDLTLGPLFRFKVVRLEDQRHFLLLTIHHIIADDWSMKLLDQEFETLYDVFSKGLSSPLPELTIQYADFAVWQREWLQGKVLEAHVAFWQEQLTGDLPVLQLPTDRVRPRHVSYRGTNLNFAFSSGLSLAIRSFSDREGATSFMTLIAAYSVLLCRYSGQDDVIIGCPIAGRNHVETENLVGFFLSTLLIRPHLSGNPTFRELLKKTREVCLGAHTYQEVPYEALLERLRVKRDLSRTPLFQTIFALLNTPPVESKFKNFQVFPVSVNNGTTKFELSLTMREVGQVFRGVLDYSTDLFDPSTMRSLIERFQILLEAAVNNPDMPISHLPMMTEEQRRQLLAAGRGKVEEFTRGLCIHQLFEAQVKRTPDAVAIEFGAEHLTYLELNQRASKLAHWLAESGAGPEKLVGICTERSIEMVVAMLGVLKAGAAYLPLDPAYPQHRIAFMLQDAQVSILLTQQSLLSRLPEHPIATFCLDSDSERIAARPSGDPPCCIVPQNQAYVIYTSGSTGKPKGVVVTHQSLVNYTESASREYGVAANDRVLQFASISFDTSAEEIYPCLTCGATLVLRSEEMLNSVGAFARACRQMEITILNLPTAYWHEIVSRLGSEELDVPVALRLVIVGGERALPEKLAVWQQFVADQPVLVNTYGPTEATIVTTRCHLVAKTAEEAPGREVPIGRPIENARVYVLDPSLQPVPAGIPGELYVGGAGLARGYLRRPDITAERFVPDPFSEGPGERLYKTGDLVRFLPDGALEYVGRIDQQVKIRGYRIELGEIEAVLAQHPAIKDVVVLAREDEPGQKQLAAYLVSGEAEPPSIADLRSFVNDKLPGYMIPSAFIFLEKLPLNASGKIDRQALPAPGGSRPDLKKEFVGPRTPTEEVLASVWAAMLKLDKVGIYDNFFELGGHSLLATQIISRILDALQVEIPLKTFFEMPTIAELAQIVDAADRSSASDLREIATALDQLEQLSEEEVAELLKERS